MGVKVTDSVCDPTARMVPVAGEYANVPGTVELALSCVALSAVPYVIAAGAAHAMVDVALLTVSVTDAVAVVYAVVSVGVKVTDSVCDPAFSTVPAAGV